LSDLHWSKSIARDVDIVFDALKEDLKELAKTGITPDLCIFSGDLAIGGDDIDVIDDAWQAFITPLSQFLSLSPCRVFVTPGNHDIARETVRSIPTIDASLRTSLTSIQAVNKFIDSPASPSSESGLALKRMDNFYVVHDTRTADPISATPYLRTYSVDIDGLKVGVACLNSAWRATGEKDDIDYGHLLIGERNIDSAASDLADCDYRIAVHHHPLDWLEPSDHRAVDLVIKRQFDLTCVGHLHNASPEKLVNSNGSCIVSQAGSIFAGRAWFNGYNIIEVDIPSRTHRVHVRSYFDEGRRFDKATNVCRDGVIEFTSDPNVDRRRIDLVELFLRENRQILRDSVANHLNLIGSDEFDAESLIRQYVTPPIVRRRLATDEGNTEQSNKIYSVSEIISGHDNILIIGERHTGKSSLAHYIAHELVFGKGRCDTIPLVIDLNQHKYNKYSLRRAVRSYYETIPVGFDIDSAINDGIFTFIIDNLPVSEQDMKALASHIDEHSACRWIAMGTPNTDGVSPDRLFKEHLPSFAKFGIRELNRAGIRAVARIWTRGSDSDASRVYDAVMRQLQRDGLPRTPYMISLLVWAIQQKIGRQSLNEATLLENIIDHLIGKADFRLASRSAFSPRAKEITLQAIAQFMFDRGGVAGENDTLSYLISFFESKKVPYVASDVLDKLVSCGVISRDGDGVRFKYPAFQEYFMAKKLGSDAAVLGHYLKDLNFLQVRRELELLSGLRQENDEIIQSIMTLLNSRVPDIFSRINVKDFDSDERSRLQPGTTLSQLNRIKKKRLTYAQFDAMMDEVDRRALSRGERPLSESLERADGDYVAAAREREAESIAIDANDIRKPLSPYTHMAAIDTLARVIRNSDFSDFAVKGPAVRMVLESWVRIYLLVIEELKALIAASDSDASSPINEKDRALLNYIVSKWVFSIIGRGVVDHMSTPSMAGTLTSFLDSGEISTGEILLVLYLLEDIDANDWRQHWSALIADKSRSGFVIDCIVTRLGVITHSKALDDDQAERVREIVDEIQRRLDWTPQKKNEVLQDLKDVANLAALGDLTSGP
jgi:predicted MPP superfamily phosphohydrolase